MPIKGFFSFLVLTLALVIPAVSAASCLPKLKNVGTVALCGSLAGFGGCSSPNHRVSDVQAILPNSPALLASAEAKLQSQTYRWVLHIHFRPNDFGGFRGAERSFVTKLEKGNFFEAAESPALNFDSSETFQIETRKLAKALPLFQDSPFLIGEFEFYHNQAGDAFHFVEDLLSEPSTSLSETFLIVSAGSHGSSAANSFIRKLRHSHGKNADLIILGDAISQPLFLPMRMADPGNAVAVHFFQRNDFLSGRPVANFYNIELEEGDHVSAAGYSDNLGSTIARAIDLSAEPARVRAVHFTEEDFLAFEADLLTAGFPDISFGPNYPPIGTVPTVITSSIGSLFNKHQSDYASLRAASAKAIRHLGQSFNTLSRWTAYELVSFEPMERRELWRRQIGINPQQPEWAMSLPNFRLVPQASPSGPKWRVEGLSHDEVRALIEWLEIQTEDYWDFVWWLKKVGLESPHAFAVYPRQAGRLAPFTRVDTFGLLHTREEDLISLMDLLKQVQHPEPLE